MAKYSRIDKSDIGGGGGRLVVVDYKFPELL
jgi:hypothetical protein